MPWKSNELSKFRRGARADDSKVDNNETMDADHRQGAFFV